MRKTAFLMAAAAFASGAQAQSSVTLYGQVDAYVSHIRAGSISRTFMGDGGNGASQFGLRGVEDLGGGQKVGFTLESGLNLPNGAGTLPGPALAWTRQSFLYISGPWGKLEMGRMYTPAFFHLHRTDPFGVNAIFSPLNAITITDAQQGMRPFAARASNQFRYSLPAGLPVAASLAYGHGDSTANTVKRSRFMGGNVSWTQGKLFVGYAFQRFEDGAEAAITSPLGKSTHQLLSVAYQTPGNLQLSANYMHTSSSLAGVAKSNAGSVSAAYAFSPTSLVMAEYLHRRVTGSKRAQHILSLGYDHNLSKRTALYGRFMYISNRADAAGSLGGAPVLANSGSEVRMVGLGIRHRF